MRRRHFNRELFSLSNLEPLSSPDHRPLGLFSSFQMTQIFTLCPPPAPFPLPWPVPKGSSAHGGQVSCRPLNKHGADVRGPKTMLGSSKQTRTCTQSLCHVALHGVHASFELHAEKQVMRVPSWSGFETPPLPSSVWYWCRNVKKKV